MPRTEKKRDPSSTGTYIHTYIHTYIRYWNNQPVALYLWKVLLGDQPGISDRLHTGLLYLPVWYTWPRRRGVGVLRGIQHSGHYDGSAHTYIHTYIHTCRVISIVCFQLYIHTYICTWHHLPLCTSISSSLMVGPINNGQGWPFWYFLSALRSTAWTSHREVCWP